MKRWEDEENPQNCLGSSFELGKYIIFSIQMKKLTVCKQSIMKFNAMKSPETVIY